MFINIIMLHVYYRTKWTIWMEIQDIPIRAFYGKCANCDISETTLPITKTKNQDHFLIQSTPQNMEKLTSETTFGHSKKFVVIASYKNADFEILDSDCAHTRLLNC